jgi:hypothetical protein
MNRKSTQYLLLAFLLLLSSLPLLKAQGPTCTIWSPDGNVSSRPDSVPFRVSFSKVVTGFQPSDVLVFGGLIIGMTPTTPDSSYTVYVRADSCLIMTMQIFAGAAQDSLGNQSQGAQLFTLRYDTCSPKVIFTPHYGNPTGANPIPVDIDFKERVTGFTTSDILLANATLSGAPVNYQNLDSLFTIQIVPTGPGLTIISLSLDSAAVTDVAQLVNDSTGITIVYDPTLASISQYQDDPKVKLYPNPGNGIFNVYDADNSFSSWELYDVEGKKTKLGNLNFGGMIDAAAFSEGQYLLVLYGDQKVITRKLIIQK